MPLTALLALICAQNQPETVPLKLVRSGITHTVGGFATRMITLSTKKPNGITRLPGNLSQPLYGTLNLGGGRFFVVLAMQGKLQRLFVDSNSNGDLQDDAPATWHQKVGDHAASGSADVNIPFSGHKAACNVIFVQSSPKSLSVILDYGFTGQLTLGKAPETFWLLDGTGSGFGDGTAAGATLAFDRTGKGWIDSNAERYVADRPFTINNTSYFLKSVSMPQATATFMPGEKVPEVPMPALLTVGHVVPSFSGKNLDGKQVSFPADFKSSVVLIYVWASWSAPSLEWLPKIKQAYTADKGRGFDVIGICLNRQAEGDAAKTAAAQMPWATLFDGKSWRGEEVKALNIDAVPYLLLVDGQTGKVLATMSDMVGDGFAKATSASLHGTVEK